MENIKVKTINEKIEENISILNGNIYVYNYLIEKQGLPKLSDRELDILKDRFLIPKLTYETIGNKYNITKERVRQIYKNTIRKIKQRYINYIVIKNL